MKRSELKRKTALVARSSLRPSSPSRSAKRSPDQRARRSATAEASAEFRREVMARDGHRCRCCGGAATEAHHAAQRSTHPALKAEPGIGIALCLGCHHWTHANPARATERGLLVPGWMQDRSEAIEFTGPRGRCECRG